jgi:hypothetical protein
MKTISLKLRKLGDGSVSAVSRQNVEIDFLKFHDFYILTKK